MALLCCIVARGTVTFYPDSLTWSSEDTSAKIVTVYSSGSWRIFNRAGQDIYFDVSPMSGTSGTEVTITPRHVNHTDMENFEDLYFTDNSEETKLFRLTQLSWADSFYVSPDSLSWNAGETATKQVSLNSPGGWTAFTDTPGYNVSPASGTGNATLMCGQSPRTPQAM